MLWIPEKKCVYTEIPPPNQIAEEELLGTDNELIAVVIFT